MLKLRHFSKIVAHFDFDSSNRSQKKLKQGQQKAGRVKQMEEHLTTNYSNWHQVSNMTVYKEAFQRDRASWM